MELNSNNANMKQCQVRTGTVFSMDFFGKTHENKILHISYEKFQKSNEKCKSSEFW